MLTAKAARVAARLKQDLGVEPKLAHGRLQELSVLVGDKVVARKKWFRFPKDEAVVAAVRTALAENG
ncbi:MAG: hypothetical protein HY735_15875 [Verrucomicrobia bacterium]|nr:hypothetical protein [Verrucomicrobiota bacterium]